MRPMEHDPQPPPSAIARPTAGQVQLAVMNLLAAALAVERDRRIAALAGPGLRGTLRSDRRRSALCRRSA